MRWLVWLLPSGVVYDHILLGGVSATATTMMMDTPSFLTNPASTGHSTRGVQTPHHHDEDEQEDQQEESIPSPQPLRLTTLLPVDQWHHHHCEPAWIDKTPQQQQQQGGGDAGTHMSPHVPMYYSQGELSLSHLIIIRPFSNRTYSYVDTT